MGPRKLRVSVGPAADHGLRQVEQSLAGAGGRVENRSSVGDRPPPGTPGGAPEKSDILGGGSGRLNRLFTLYPPVKRRAPSRGWGRLTSENRLECPDCFAFCP